MQTQQQPDPPSGNRRDRLYSIRDGLPTSPDVEVLIKEFPDLRPGDKIAYDDFARILGVQQQGRRFWAVATAWRKRLHGQQVVIGCQENVCFYVKTADEIIADSPDVCDAIRRKAKTQRSNLMSIRGASDGQRAIIDHHARMMLAIEREGADKRRLQIPAPGVSLLPQRKPPE